MKFSTKTHVKCTILIQKLVLHTDARNYPSFIKLNTSLFQTTLNQNFYPPGHQQRLRDASYPKYPSKLQAPRCCSRHHANQLQRVLLWLWPAHERLGSEQLAGHPISSQFLCTADTVRIRLKTPVKRRRCLSFCKLYSARGAIVRVGRPEGRPDRSGANPWGKGLVGCS